MTFFEAAEHYVSLGFNVFPLRPGSKEPLTKHGVHDATTDVEVLARYARRCPDANIAIACGPDSGQVGTLVIDIDKHHGGIESMQTLLSKRTALPACPMSRTPQGGYHLFFRHDPRIGNTQNLLGQGIDVKSKGGYVVLPPSQWDGCKKGERVADGGIYRWMRPPLGSSLPTMPQWMLRRLLPKPPPAVKPKPWDHTNADLSQVAKALKFVPNHDYEKWIKIGMALKADIGDPAFDLWCEWSSSGYANYDQKECTRKWRSFNRNDGVGIGSVFREARMGGADLKTIFGERGGLAA